MEKDLICGMDIDPTVALTSQYNGKTYFFCSTACKEMFDKEPEKYANKDKPSGGSCCCGC